MKKICFLILILLLLITGCSVKKTTELTDAEKFSKEYGVSVDNPFEYVTIDEAIDIVKNKTGIIFFGNSDCEWCVENAKILTEVLIEQKIEKAYYYNPKNISDKNTKKYKKLLSVLSEYIEKDENDNMYLFLPDTYFIKGGKIIGHNNELSNMDMTEDDELTPKRKKKIKNQYLKLITEYKK